MWQIIEEPSYLPSVSLLGRPEEVDEYLAFIDYALSRNPFGFHKVPGARTVYIAKTKLRVVGLQIIPAYRLWFRIDQENRVVRKLYIELCPAADMPYGSTFNDEGDNLPS